MVVYRIDEHENHYEREVACVNLLKHRHFSVVVERESRANFYVKFQIRDYFRQGLMTDLTKFSGSRIRFSLVKRLTDLGADEIERLREEFPRVLLDSAFKTAIPELYWENKRIKSDKYKRLLIDFDWHMSNYARVYGKGDDLVLSDWGLD